MSSSDGAPPFHGEATGRIAAEAGSPLADVAEETARLKALAARIAGLAEGEGPSPEMIAEGLTVLTRLYSVRHQRGERWDPLVDGRAMPVTSVMIMTTAMLKAVNVELFELGMWQAWSSG